MTETSLPFNPFTNIAFAASGGGFRASAYTLGSLSYLNIIQYKDVPLLHQVTYLSSTSGGSITTAFYMKSLIEKKSFYNFYHSLLSFLDGEKVLIQAYRILNNKKLWQHNRKQRNLINAFAKVYDEELGGITFGELFYDQTIPVKEICFNSTEFHHGLPFRFQTQETGVPNLIGNHFINFKDNKAAQDCAKRIKVGDIVAASSCFPAGFEPMNYPFDFTHDGLSEIVLKKSLNRDVAFSLMDGGITDNQAVGSMKLANNRRIAQSLETGYNNPFNLVIVTDVSNLYISPYKPKLKGKIRSELNFSINSIWKLLNLAPYLAALSLILMLFQNRAIHTLGAMFFPLFTVLFIIKKSISNLLKKTRKRSFINKSLSWDKVISPYISFFSNLDIGTLINMISERMSSVVILASDLFLKRIRRGDYENLFDDPSWEHKRIANFIYELSSSNKSNRSRQFEKDEWRSKLIKSLTPSQELEATAERARKMDTTLWFDEAHKSCLSDLIITGQFTVCYNLIKYISRLEKDKNFKCTYTQEVQQQLLSLKLTLLCDWDKFNQRPDWLYNKYLQSSM